MQTIIFTILTDKKARTKRIAQLRTQAYAAGMPWFDYSYIPTAESK